MMSLIIFLGVVLILAILLHDLQGEQSCKHCKGRRRDEKGGTANKVNAALFIVFMVGSLGWFLLVFVSVF